MAIVPTSHTRPLNPPPATLPLTPFATDASVQFSDASHGTMYDVLAYGRLFMLYFSTPDGVVV
jgi:hypothetical protein